jgi:glycosyltransferase involved in cell wall biosynthesis
LAVPTTGIGRYTLEIVRRLIDTDHQLFLYTVHDMVWKRHGETMVRLGRLIEQLLMPKSLRKARRVIAVSHATAEDIVTFYPEIDRKIVVIPEATSLHDVAPDSQQPPAQPYMLFVGTMEPRKNLNAVLDAYRSLLDSGVTTHRFVIAGNPGWKNENIHLKLKREPFSTYVDLRGKVTDEHLVRLYGGADFVVAPSLYEVFLGACGRVHAKGASRRC